MAERDLAPRTVGELLDAAFFVYRRNFARLALVSLVVALPALLTAVLFAEDANAALRSYWNVVVDNATRNRPEDFGENLQRSMNAAGKMQFYGLLTGVLQSFERAAGVVTMSVAAAAALRREAAPSIDRIVREAVPRLPAAILVQVVLDSVLGLCMLCLPIGIALTVMASCIAPAIARERGPLETSARASVPGALRWAVLPFAEAIDGIARSFRLTAHVETIARGTALVFLLLAFVGIANGLAMGLGALLAGSTGGWFWAQHCSEALVLPIWGLGISFWHADLRARREGADLEPAA